jgi:hypothetical protein
MRRRLLTGPRRRRVLVAGAVLLVGILGTSAWAVLRPPTPSPAPQSPAPTYSGGVSCREDTFAHVHNANRLRLVAPCATVTGTVDTVTWQPTDGDWQVELVLDASYAPYVPDIREPLDLKVIPADMATVALPRPGDRVAASGAWVNNRNQSGAPQLHPTWSIERLDQTGDAAAPPPPEPAGPGLQVLAEVPAQVQVGDTFTLSAVVTEPGPEPKRVPLAHLWLEVLPERGRGVHWKAGATDSAGAATLEIVALFRPGPYELHLYVERHGRVTTVIEHLEVVI